MKRFFTTSILTISILNLSFIFSGCFIIDAIDDAKSECDEKQNIISPPETRNFLLTALVKFKDGSPAQDYFVTFKYKHEYCSGTINGEEEIHPANPTDEYGYVKSSWNQNYLYNNVKDRVHVEVVASLNCDLGRTTKVYRWEDVDDDLIEHVGGDVLRIIEVRLDYNIADYIGDLDNELCLDSDDE